jgi:hypothetical protein
MSYSGFGGGRIKSRVQISLRVRILGWVLYYHRELPKAIQSSDVRLSKGLINLIEQKKKNEKKKKKPKKFDRVKGNIVRHMKRP